MGFLGLEKFYKMTVESLFCVCVCDLITMMNLGFHERKRECLRLVCVKNYSMREERSGSWGALVSPYACFCWWVR